MTSLPERRPLIRGEHFDGHGMGMLRDESMALPHRRTWELD